MCPQNAHIVQLPFPSQRSPHESIVNYYRDYSRFFAQFVDSYFIPENSLWELPLWVAHLAGMLESVGYHPNFVDLSASACNAEDCVKELLMQTRAGEQVLLSPLAQNFDLALTVSRRLMKEQRITILGGNMAPLAETRAATVVHHGQATPRSLASSLPGATASVSNTMVRGEEAGWFPNYQLLASYRGHVPLLRLNASHGCLYACDFCGDAWSNRLILVPRPVLEHEIRQFENIFPDTRLIYIGDKTFGQSKDAVLNLLAVFSRRPQYRFIIQTHVLAINDELIDAMEQVGVVVVELGFESGSTKLLQQHHKPNVTPELFSDRIARLARRGMHVVLNVLGGLPNETREAHQETLAFINSARCEAQLYNLYNFVPYPLTAQFRLLRPRIFDWDFSHWREDGPPVFQPYHLTPDESFELFLEKVAVAHDAIVTRRHSFGVQTTAAAAKLQSAGAR